MFVVALVVGTGVAGTHLRAEESAGDVAVHFFEQRIRPVLIEHCYPCHSDETEQAGGLALDRRSGWQTGGDSGPAIVPGDIEASRLFRVIAYTDAELEMPPDGKLPAAVVADFEKWIRDGAGDPRVASDEPETPKKPTEIDWETAREHWAYRPLAPIDPPSVPPTTTRASEQQFGPIDRFILAKLAEKGFSPSHPAADSVLLRRLAIDLTGLPPSPDLVAEFSGAAGDPSVYERIVDRLIASPDFAERFARHWLDVARYAESVTLRGLVQPQAWRYRDYVIDALHRDRSWRDVLREQIAGDLIEYDAIEDRQLASIAVTFLCMGNSNLENQQKTGLEMDFIDEQLDTLGRAMLGQTIGCARCHDHKFDPIPTSDYYAMAGVLHGWEGIEHANVSRWIDKPLPLAPDDQAHFDRLQSDLDAVNDKLQQIKRQLDGSGAADSVIVLSSLAGIVVDDAEARKVGQWKESVHTKPFVAAGYIHDENSGQGEKSLTFEPSELPPGRYDVRISYCASANRASQVPVTVFSADGETTVTINQRTRPPIDGVWESLGTFRFEPRGQAFVMISNEGTDGHVIGDAIQFLPLADAETADVTQGTDPDDEADSEGDQLRRLQADQKRLTARQSALRRQLGERPLAMGLRPRPEAGDLPIHIRGSIHNLGPVAPRGVLRVIAGDDASLPIDERSRGRLEMADWIADDANPLTARVLVNRVWLWVMGEGLVRTPDNFGTTGQAPTHPELLDWLTDRFIRENWSIKRLVKRIVMSSTYRQTSRVALADDARQATDPDNRLWWRSDRKPLSAEALRDSVLEISGQLDRGGPGSRIRPGTSADYGYQHDELLRSIYLPVFRNAIPEVLETFNYTDTSFVTGRRQRGIVAQQALAILNHPWFAERAAAAAERNWLQIDGDVGDRIIHAFVQTLSRRPDSAELTAATDYFHDCLAADARWSASRSTNEDSPATRMALAQVYLGLFATAEFRQLD